MMDKEETLIFVVRHGETEWNLAGRAQGHLDSPLTATGIQQAHALADGLFGRGIETIYSSDLGRAMQTAETIADKLGLSVNVEPRLRERHGGSIQGWVVTEFQERYPKEIAALNSDDLDYALPGGESSRQHFERCVACCADLAARHPGETILVVSHGDALMCLFNHTLGLPLSALPSCSMFNAAIDRISIRGDFSCLDTWGDISHLREMTTLDDN